MRFARISQRLKPHSKLNFYVYFYLPLFLSILLYALDMLFLCLLDVFVCYLTVLILAHIIKKVNTFYALFSKIVKNT